MANKKQDGANVVNAEYSSGRCRTLCEQCFVNFGDRGLTASLNIFQPKNVHALAYALEVGKADAPYMAIPYKPAPKVKKAVPEGYVPIPRAVMPSGTGMYNIPYQAGRPKKAKRDLRLSLEMEFPIFCRVSTMSDSLYAPSYWLAELREYWKDQCFFNTSIKTLGKVLGLKRTMALDEVHKLVITSNPGEQRMQKLVERWYAPKGKAKGWFATAGGIRGSMGEVAALPGDFFHPLTIDDIGVHDLEGRMKWYRLRALPTICARYKTDPEVPVVVTKLRFKGVEHVLEFCRRYGLNCQFLAATSSTHYCMKRGAAEFGAEDSVVDARGQIKKSMVRIWSGKKDSRNILADRRGAASEFIFIENWWRPVTDFDWARYVCDRLHESCKLCGLCASLDGTQEGNINWSNEIPTGTALDKFLLPRGDGAYVWNPDAPGYIGLLEKPTEGEFFGKILERLEDKSRVYQRNPMDIDEALDAIEKVSSYYSGDSYFCEGWNTHEDADTSMALAVWTVMRHAVDKGKDLEWVLTTVADRGGMLTDELVSMWTNESMWTEQFGEL